MRLVRFWPDYFFCSFWLKLKIIIRGMCLWGPVNPNNKKYIYNFALAEWTWMSMNEHWMSCVFLCKWQNGYFSHPQPSKNKYQISPLVSERKWVEKLFDTQIAVQKFSPGLRWISSEFIKCSDVSWNWPIKLACTVMSLLVLKKFSRGGSLVAIPMVLPKYILAKLTYAVKYLVKFVPWCHDVV